MVIKNDINKKKQEIADKYDAYIKEHRTCVKLAYNWLVEKGIIEDIVDIEKHDLSKYSDEEFWQYANYFYGKDELGKSATTSIKQKIDKEFDYAWLHHIHNNPHHWQYWVLMNDEDGTYALTMPRKYVYEMIADWFAFSFRLGDLKLLNNWYTAHKYTMILSSETRELVEDILEKIRENI